MAEVKNVPNLCDGLMVGGKKCLVCVCVQEILSGFSRYPRYPNGVWIPGYLMFQIAVDTWIPNFSNRRGYLDTNCYGSQNFQNVMDTWIPWSTHTRLPGYLR